MNDKQEIYCSFLLRIWIEPVDEDQWRFSLEDTQTGERRGFVSLVKLMSFLDQLIEQDCENPLEDE